MNIQRLLPQRRINLGICLKRISPISFILTVFVLTFSISCIQAETGVPLEKIRDIISKKALIPVSPARLKNLNSRNLDAGLRAIDQYAHYFTYPSALKKSSSNLKLGIDVFSYKSSLWIRTVPDGPARNAGVPEIGRLLAINNKVVQNNDVKIISKRLDVALQSNQVILTIAQKNSKFGKNYRITPAAFLSSSITWKEVNNYTVINIKEFVAHETAPRFFASYKTLVKSGMRVILDLRGCEGGDLYEALEIAGMFVPAGLPLANVYDRSGAFKTCQSPPGEKLKYPAWLLLDHNTASSAEIVAGILQHYRFTRLIGEKSYGKFTSQTVFPLSGGELWLTTLSIRLPDNVSREGVGVKPDITYPDITITQTNDIISKISKGMIVPY